MAQYGPVYNSNTSQISKNLDYIPASDGGGVDGLGPKSRTRALHKYLMIQESRIFLILVYGYSHMFEAGTFMSSLKPCYENNCEYLPLLVVPLSEYIS
ncbi:hypothetical protein Csa_005602 [Cucumis sativus]|uniref:Uncharacterized protein n=1 Tax=Cucumis sativus TaxID=3659 RepID=A0A0A0KD92_CUCSA|nr:hypothetical protein Csa_005602 [Cucumis sativus]